MYQTIDPTTGQPGQSFASISNQELMDRLTTAHDVYNHKWRTTTLQDRIEIIARAATLLRQNRDKYASLITLEVGKLINASYYEIDLSASIFEYYATHGIAFLEPQILADVPGVTVYTEPIGVLLAIAPWNFPFYQLARVAAPQLLAGNVVMAKHAPSVPQCALAFEELFIEAAAPQGVWTNVFCTIEQSSLLIEDFRVRGVTLTGSERAGSSVGEQAGKHLKKVVLELGGSDPFLVLPDADLDLAIKAAVAGRLANMGQACVGSKRFIVVGKERGERVLQGMKDAFESLVPGDPADATVTLGPLVNENILQGLLTQITDAKEAGASIVTGGYQLQRPGFYLAPTIITNIDEQNPLFRQEAFGPVASLYVVDSEDEAISLANATPFGLGASVLSSNVEHALKVAARIDSGMVWINSGGFSTPEVPFGGTKNSGFGRELSELGIGEFVNKKMIRVRS